MILLPPVSPQPRTNPYVGPRPFRAGEKLYGREREKNALFDLLLAQRIILLYSPSGAGKSSLINAALLPGMTAQGFEVLPAIRINLEPPPEIASRTQVNRYVLSALLSLEEDRPRERRCPLQDLAGLSLDEYLRRRGAEEAEQPSYLLVFDQFEEILTTSPTDREGKLAFFAQVGQALRDRSRWALFSMREDYIAALEPYLRLVPTRLENRFRLDLLGVEGAMQAVRRPAESAGVTFDTQAAARLVDDLRRVKAQQADGSLLDLPGLYVEPVQLQVVCSRLWDNLPENRTEITLADLEAAGDTDKALAGYYDTQVSAIADRSGVPLREIRKWFDTMLITVSGIRGQVLFGKDATGGLPNAAVIELEHAHLIRGEKRGGATWYELAHDRLVHPVRESNAAWFGANLAPIQRQAEVWEANGRPDGMLFTGQSLERSSRLGRGERRPDDNDRERLPG